MTTHNELTPASTHPIELSIRSLWSFLGSQISKMIRATKKPLSSELGSQNFHADNAYQQRHAITYVAPRF